MSFINGLKGYFDEIFANALVEGGESYYFQIVGNPAIASDVQFWERYLNMTKLVEYIPEDNRNCVQLESCADEKKLLGQEGLWSNDRASI